MPHTALHPQYPPAPPPRTSSLVTSCSSSRLSLAAHTLLSAHTHASPLLLSLHPCPSSPLLFAAPLHSSSSQLLSPLLFTHRCLRSRAARQRGAPTRVVHFTAAPHTCCPSHHCSHTILFASLRISSLLFAPLRFSSLLFALHSIVSLLRCSSRSLLTLTPHTLFSSPLTPHTASPSP